MALILTKVCATWAHDQQGNTCSTPVDGVTELDFGNDDVKHPGNLPEHSGLLDANASFEQSMSMLIIC